MARILVVDDRVENRDLFSYLLGYFGHQVSTAPGGAAAVRAALADPPDLIVMDIDMPGIDGYAAARLIRAEAALRDLPLVAVSVTDTASPEKAREAGFDAFYPMPIEPRDFVEQVESSLRSRDAAEDRSRSEP
jgi:CheY-like chemotaxis protein